MRVLCLNPYLPPPLGGIEKEMLAVAGELVLLGHQVTVLTTTARFPSGDNVQFEGAPDGVVVERVRGVFRSTLRGFAPARPPLFVPGLATTAVALRPDLVLVFNVGWGPVIRPVISALRAASNPPVILYRTYFHPPGGILAPYKIPYILRTVAKADRAMVATAVEQRELAATGYLSSTALSVLPPGVHVHGESPELVEQQRDRYRLRGRRVIAHVGRLCAFKGTHDLVSVLPRVRADAGGDVVLLLIGADQEPVALAAAIARHGVAEHVRIVGEVRDDRTLRALLRCADVMALPSEYEAYGIAYIEALAEGVPCIGCDVGGVAEAIDDAGVLLPKFGDRDGLTQALVQLLGDDERRRALGERGRKRVHSSLTWGHTARRMLTLAAEVQSGNAVSRN